MSDHPSKLAAFLAELRRRRVFRVAAVYACVAFIIFQIVDATFEPLRLPDWASTLVVVLLALGFPIAVGMAWAFDLTTEGLVRAKPKREPIAAKAPHHVVIGNKTLAIIAVMAVIAAAWSWLREPSPGGALISSIAVLPLDDLMGDPEQEYFVEGMHDAIISNLSRLSALKVISRTSAMRYKDTDKLLPEIARELGVDALVEGSVLKAGNRVRITAQLIHGASDEHLWSNDYEGDLTDILSLQKTIARAIAGEIGLALKPEEETYLASAPQVNPEAYTAYLQGHHIMWEQRDFQSVIPLFEAAIALDPSYAPPYADLAYAYTFWPAGDASFEQAIAKAQELIDRAISLDPQLPTAYSTLGNISFVQGGWQEADEAFRQAIAIAPNSREANVQYGWFLLRAGKVDQALGYMELALQLDPLSVHSHRSLAIALYFQQRYDQALEVITRGLRLDPHNPSKVTTGMIYLRMGKYEEAIEIFDNWAQVPSHLQGLIHVARGERSQALQLIEEINSLEPGEKTWLDDLAPIFIYAALGELDLAMDQLERLYKTENSRLVLDDFGIGYFKVEPAYDPLRDHPRFQALVKDLYGE